MDLSNETPEYYIQAIKDIGPWTDIYALGATMYNLLTDSIPPSKRRLEKEGRNAFSFPTNVSSKTQDLIVRMMKVKRNERIQSVYEVRGEMEKYQKKEERVNRQRKVNNVERPRQNNNEPLLQNILIFMGIIITFGGLFYCVFTEKSPFATIGCIVIGACVFVLGIAMGKESK